MKKATIKKAYDKALEKEFSQMSERKQKQIFTFEDELRAMVIQTIADDSAYWEFDFDRDEYNVPNNWDDMTMEEKAEFVYENTAWLLEDWLSYYQYEFED